MRSQMRQPHDRRAGNSASGSALRGLPRAHEDIDNSLLRKERKLHHTTLHLSTVPPMTGGFYPWSIFNEHRWSNLNARGQREHKKVVEGALI